MSFKFAWASSAYLQIRSADLTRWHPWIKESFELAKTLDKPIFLSIGYATSPLCHQMGQESFNNPEVSDALNRVFIPIVVDKVEQPDVDHLYLTLSQMLLGVSVGWPLNLVLTPDLKPFFAFSYLPAFTNKNAIGLKELIDQIEVLWNGNERKLVLEQADLLLNTLKKVQEVSHVEKLSEKLLAKALDKLSDNFDPLQGGLKGVPKFPSSYMAELLLPTYPEFANHHLLCLAQKGIKDPVEGGIFRSCLDEAWEKPSFEMMLYDQAFAASAFLTTDLKKAHELILFIQQVFGHPEGSFFSALGDLNGSYYTFTKDELKKALGIDFNWIDSFYTLKNGVLIAEFDLAAFANLLKLPEEQVQLNLKRAHAKLAEYRHKRGPLFKDEMIVCAYNGYMIDLLSKASLVKSAKDTALFIEKYLVKEGRLYRSYYHGVLGQLATLQDYSSLIRGLISLHEVSHEKKWMDWALALAQEIQTLFYTNDEFYLESLDPYLLENQSELADGSEPSSLALHTENLLRLYDHTQEISFLEQADAIFKKTSFLIKECPAAAAYHLKAGVLRITLAKNMAIAD